MADSASTTAAHAFVQRLIDLGLKHAVLSPGSRNAPISITLAQAAQRGLLTLHVRVDEREAAFLALGLGKAGDVPTLLCCTSGTAAVNFAPAVVEAYYSQVPLVVLTADRPEGAAARGASQSIEQQGLFAPHAVANLSVAAAAGPDSAADRARIAWNAARGLRRGPAHVNMHLSEPLLSPADSWPQVRAAEPFAVSAPAEVTPLLPELPSLGAKPVMVIGEVAQHERNAVTFALDAARALRIPVLMEPTAGARDEAVSIRHHWLVTDEFAAQASAVITFGRFGLGRHLRRLCERAPSHVAFAAHGAGADPFATADVSLHLACAGAALAQLAAGATVDASWLPQWRAADAAAHTRVATALADWAQAPTGLHVAAEVLASAQALGSAVFAAASRSVRDVDLVADFDGPAVHANLGVNGIDGLISTAAGVATAAARHTFLLIGDIAFLHGSNGLLTAVGEPQPPLTTVVVDDNGGAIFSDLEQGAADYEPWFERVFATPHGLDLVTLARGYGVPARQVDDLTQLREALSEGQAGVIVVRAADRRLSRDLRASLRH
ncbi:MAG: 2-succinyl-5-enolpyruvyl-6-hydroxy-3-cyclohexene-1-carboxylic-acid synthase [Actinomycetales bacterium]|nr:2-succinyl-5-enolpyruvyl-6-hydroxy-3-cyclohexene-1-carboxylic-acid synthase [Actinomycetales bacterium]